MSEEKKPYEIAFLARTEADKEAVLRVLAQIGAENISEGKFSEIKLAYPIKKQTSAFFGSATFESVPNAVLKIDEPLKFAEGVLRHILVTPPTKKYVPRFSGVQREEEIQPETKPMAEEEKENLPEAEVAENKEEYPGGGKVDEAALDEKLAEILNSAK
ncbi:MAG: 30S ribosomal protein S6 [Parcubacteria group bacterium]